MSLGINNTASVSDVSQVVLTVTGKLNPASDSGVSNTEEITDVVRPDFVGTASQPDATISLYATAAGSTTPVLIGTGTSDASGAWSITADQALADGSYAITAVAANPSDQMVSGTTTVVPDLVIDTVGPKVTGVSVDRKRGRIVVTFQDFGGLNNTGVGLDMASVVDAGNYQLVAANHPRGPAYRMTVASVTPGTTGGTETVTLRVTGRTSRPRRSGTPSGSIRQAPRTRAASRTTPATRWTASSPGPSHRGTVSPAGISSPASRRSRAGGPARPALLPGPSPIRTRATASYLARQRVKCAHGQ